MRLFRDIVFFVSIISLAGFTGAAAGIAPEQCNKILVMNEANPFPFYFQRGREYLPLTQANEATFWLAVQNQPANSEGFTFVYLAPADSGAQSTFFLVKQRYAAGAGATKVGVFNNVRRRSAYPKFSEFQEYHQGEGARLSWVQWLHIKTGWIGNSDSLDSTEVPFPRSQFAFEQSQNGDDLKAYLLAVRGVPPQGTCLDFSPTVPRATRNISISITNIRMTETGDPREPFAIRVERPQ